MDVVGAPIKVRQSRLGHSDPRMTLGTYTHVASDDDRRVAGAIGALLLHHKEPQQQKGPTIM
jgi:integrase